jgi:hypothetical protein
MLSIIIACPHALILSYLCTSPRSFLPRNLAVALLQLVLRPYALLCHRVFSPGHDQDLTITVMLPLILVLALILSHSLLSLHPALLLLSPPSDLSRRIIVVGTLPLLSLHYLRDGTLSSRLSTITVTFFVIVLSYLYPALLLLSALSRPSRRLSQLGQLVLSCHRVFLSQSR